jgi:hypothetical protein
MQKSTVKKISFVFALFATILLILNITNYIMVFKIERGLLDFLPTAVLQTIFVLYPISLFISYALFIVTQQTNDKYDSPVRILLIANGLILLALIAIYSINPGAIT